MCLTNERCREIDELNQSIPFLCPSCLMSTIPSAANLGDSVSETDHSVTATNTMDQSNEMLRDANNTIPVVSADPMSDVFQKTGIHVLHLNIRSLLL